MAKNNKALVYCGNNSVYEMKDEWQVVTLRLPSRSEEFAPVHLLVCNWGDSVDVRAYVAKNGYTKDLGRMIVQKVV